MIGLVAAVVAIIAATANILVMNSARSRRALLFLLTVAVFFFLGLLYKVESKRAAEEQSKITAQNREAQDAARLREVKQEEAKREEENSNGVMRTICILFTGRGDSVGAVVLVVCVYGNAFRRGGPAWPPWVGGI
jgi:high-affinity K+ transport system ATPase subunit B